MSSINLLIEDSEHQINSSTSKDHMLVDRNTLKLFDWELEDQKLCKDDQCIPVPNNKDLIKNDQFDLNILCDLINRPFVSAPDENVAYVGPTYTQFREDLASGKAPDFTFPDRNGIEHSLSDFEGKKIFLLVWASW